MNRLHRHRWPAVLGFAAVPLLAWADPSVMILGQGKARQAQEISAEGLERFMLGTNPLKAIEQLPGVHFESADAQGNYEWSTRFSLRGFNQSQLGFTLDGVPLGDMSYSNNNGLHVSRAISPENLASVTVSQGSGSVGTPSTSNLGGTVQFVSGSPRPEFTVTARQMFGSDAMSRTYVRLDSGESEEGTRGYISVTRQRAGKWKGQGEQDHDLINAKLVHAFESNRLTAFVNASDRIETDYQDISLEMIPRLGWDWDNYAPDWSRAVAAANGAFTGSVTSLDDAYYAGRGLRRDVLAGITFNGRLGGAYWTSTLYQHRNRGQGQWYTPYTPSSATMPISIRTTEYTVERAGWVNDLSWYIGTHRVQAGLWLEHSDHGLERNFYAVNGPGGAEKFLTRPMTRVFAQDFDTRTVQAYVLDTVSLLDDRLSATVGVKSPRVRTETTSRLGSQAAGTLEAKATALPQLGLNYLIAQGSEAFAALSYNQRAFQPGVIGPFSQRQTAFDLGADKLKPEKSRTFEFGYRFQGSTFSGTITAYDVRFSDRLLSVDTCAGIFGCPATFINVGKVQTRGIESAVVVPLTSDWALFGSLTLNESKYMSDYIEAGVPVPTSGRYVVDSPRRMAALELSYDNSVWHGRVGAKYSGARYYTYLNDATVPGAVVASAELGRKLGDVGDLSDVSVQLVVNNLFDKRYIATVGTNGYVTSDPAGTFQTLLAGATRQVFVTLSGRF